MSKLYLTADTDMIRATHTARGNKRVDASIGYNEGDYSKKIRTTVLRDGDNLSLHVFDSNKEVIVCKGTIQDGMDKCNLQ